MKHKMYTAQVAKAVICCHAYGRQLTRGKWRTQAVDDAELLSLANAATAACLSRWEPARGALTTYTRRFMLGEVRQAAYTAARETRLRAALCLEERTTPASQETRVRARRLLARLAPDEQELIMRYAVCGDRVEEIARDHGVAKSTISRRLKAIRAKLAPYR